MSPRSLHTRARPIGWSSIADSSWASPTWARRPMRQAISPALGTPIWTVIWRAPSGLQAAVTRCPLQPSLRSKRAPGASTGAPRSWSTTKDTVFSRRGRGGSSGGSATRTWPCSMAASPLGSPRASRSRRGARRTRPGASSRTCRANSWHRWPRSRASSIVMRSLRAIA